VSISFDEVSDEECAAAENQVGGRPHATAESEWTPILPVPADAPGLNTADPDGIVRRLAPEGYSFTTFWGYRNGAGERLGVIARYDGLDKGGQPDKQFRPFTFCEGPRGQREWRCVGFSAPRPLYGLNRLAERPGAAVIVCEGEKAAVAAGARFTNYVAVCSPNGASSAHLADWSPLAGRNVIIWPDADEPGQKFGDAARELLRGAGVASVGMMVPPDTAPKGWDAADPPEMAGLDDEGVARLLAAAEASAEVLGNQVGLEAQLEVVELESAADMRAEPEAVTAMLTAEEFMAALDDGAKAFGNGNILAPLSRSAIQSFFRGDRLPPVSEAVHDMFTAFRAGVYVYKAAVQRGEAVPSAIAVRLMDVADRLSEILAPRGASESDAAGGGAPSDNAQGQSGEELPEGIRLEDFYAFMPTHQYIYAPGRDFWPPASVNAKVPPQPLLDADGAQVLDDKGKPKFITASNWLDRNRSVEMMTWAPGMPMIVRDRLIHDGGWIDHPGVSVFNQYRPPLVLPGDAREAERWLEHVRKVYPDDWENIIPWFAHRVQRPAEKLNHALVLGGKMGVGKDTLLEPVKYAVGPWNFGEVDATAVLGRFNGYLKSVILRINEARDHGEFDRYAFYDKTKPMMAAPPDVLRVDEKHVREYPIFNVCGVIITTNHKADGIYLSPDDRRHYVAWSELTKDDFSGAYWDDLYSWYERGGMRHVAAYLAGLDISSFRPKAPPPKTAAFWAIVDAGRAPEDAELAGVLEDLGSPSAVTIADVMNKAPDGFRDWLGDRRNARKIPHRFEQCCYEPVRNPDATDGLWAIRKRRVAIYAKCGLCLRDRISAARELADRAAEAHSWI
jgi:hypothetical protein